MGVGVTATFALGMFELLLLSAWQNVSVRIIPTRSPLPFRE